jgi:hypothetical protein
LSMLKSKGDLISPVLAWTTEEILINDREATNMTAKTMIVFRISNSLIDK